MRRAQRATCKHGLFAFIRSPITIQHARYPNAAVAKFDAVGIESAHQYHLPSHGRRWAIAEVQMVLRVGFLSGVLVGWAIRQVLKLLDRYFRLLQAIREFSQ